MSALTARFAPAELPPIAIRRPSPFHRRALSAAHPIAKTESSSAAGNGCSGGQPIVEDDRQITRFGKLHPELSERTWAAERPNHRRAGRLPRDAERHPWAPVRRRKGPSAARHFLRERRLPEDRGCRRPPALPKRGAVQQCRRQDSGRQSLQNLTVAFADHASYLSALRKTLAQRAWLPGAPPIAGLPAIGA